MSIIKSDPNGTSMTLMEPLNLMTTLSGAGELFWKTGARGEFMLMVAIPFSIMTGSF